MPTVQVQTGVPVLVEQVWPLLQQRAPRPPCGGQVRSREQHWALETEDDALITQTLSPPLQHRSPQLLPGRQQMPPTPPAKPDGLKAKVSSPDTSDAAHVSPSAQHSRPHEMPEAQHRPEDVQKDPCLQQVESLSGVPMTPVTTVATLLMPKPAQTEDVGQHTPADTLPEILEPMLPPLTQREPDGQHAPEHRSPLGHAAAPPGPPAPAAGGALGSAHALPEQTLGGRQQPSAHA